MSRSSDRILSMLRSLFAYPLIRLRQVASYFDLICSMPSRRLSVCWRSTLNKFENHSGFSPHVWWHFLPFSRVTLTKPACVYQSKKCFVDCWSWKPIATKYRFDRCIHLGFVKLTWFQVAGITFTNFLMIHASLFLNYVRLAKQILQVTVVPSLMVSLPQTIAPWRTPSLSYTGVK